MELFSKLFGRKDSNGNSAGLTKTSTMLDEDMYWTLVTDSLRNSETLEEQHEFLVSRLKLLSPSEIVGFKLRTDKLLHDTYNSEMWCAGYIMNGGCSDDGFNYFRNWIISRGKEVYYHAKENPDSLVDLADDDTESYEFEDFAYAATDAFTEKTGKKIYDFIDQDNFKEGGYPTFDFTWEEENPDSMKKICPRLIERLWK
ncbi:MAG: polymerase [Bacteroidetes bacterium]|nr:MAG: polymerase [Bacteroidota bacterium]